MSFVNLFGVIAFITSTIGLLPQLVKALRIRSTHDISMAMLINYFICSLSWIIYGSFMHASFVIGSNIFGVLSSCMLIFFKWHYDYQLIRRND